MAELVYKNTPAELRSRVVAVSCTLPSLALIVTGNRTGTRARERLSFFCWVMARGATRLSRNDSRCQKLGGVLVSGSVLRRRPLWTRLLEPFGCGRVAVPGR